MMHLPELIQDLGFILITAAMVTLIFKKLNQPVVLGYLIAGFLVSSHVPYFPNVKDVASIKIWAEIGIIVLLFGLGLEFSFKKLAQTGRSATITAIFEVIFMLVSGFIFGQIMGWNQIDSLYLGGILSISSTAIIIRAFDELGLKSQKFVSLVFGVLIVEDIVAILLLVLLSTVAISRELSGQELIFSGFRLGFFLILWFIVGIYMLPTIMRKIKKYLNNETMLIVSLGLCLAMVSIATFAGFSPALGAFVMGSILAETTEGPRIEKILHPIKDLFAAVFFVSVGMMIDPAILQQYAWQIVLITLITIAGKVLSTSVGALISGVSFRHSVQAGMSLAQIGEFSFIIATLGLTLKVTSDFLYPIAVSVSAITTFATPYLIRNSDRLQNFLRHKLPENFFMRVEKYQTAFVAEQSEAGLVKILWRAYGWKTLINGVLVFAIILAGVLLRPRFGDYISFAIVCFLSIPFYWAMCFSQPSKFLTETELIRLHRLDIGVFIGRNILGFLFALYAVSSFMTLNSWQGLVSFAALTLLVFFGSTSQVFYQKIETKFMNNLVYESPTRKPKLAPWDASLATFTINPNSKYVGLTLLDSKIKETYNVTVALVERGESKHLAPDRGLILMPFDKLYLIGIDEQVHKLGIELETSAYKDGESTTESYKLRSVRVTISSPFVNKTIRESSIREKTSGLIVGIERNGEHIISPDSSMEILVDDILWIVGDYDKINRLRS
ncbi:cation:proton antiporter [Pseudobdellovibrio sp. HCB154]|uniref:cation:proton antiporter domain-containing protein n=1 Tax=Pseudobdellovibrio sp. HCB154 TaxID=3386277 RepID=UPI0039170171